MNDELFESIKARCLSASPSPWNYYPSEGYCDSSDVYCDKEEGSSACQECPGYVHTLPAYCWPGRVIDTGERDGMTDPDAIFCVHAREDIPALIAEVERLRALLGGESILT